MTPKDVFADGGDSNMPAFLPTGLGRPEEASSGALLAIPNIIFVWLCITQPFPGSWLLGIRPDVFP